MPSRSPASHHMKRLHALLVTWGDGLQVIKMHAPIAHASVCTWGNELQLMNACTRLRRR
jgi:hypothetical protein